MTANEDDVKQLLETVQTLSDTLREVLSNEDTYHSMRKALGFADWYSLFQSRHHMVVDLAEAENLMVPDPDFRWSD